MLNPDHRLFMIFSSRTYLLAALMVFFVATSCRMGDSNYYIDEGQRKELETAYDSVQSNYQKLMTAYESNVDSLPNELQWLYPKIEQMYRQMEVSHQQILARNKRHHTEDKNNRMMSGKMGMHWQNHKTGEWCLQLEGLHDEMAKIHEAAGQQSLAEMNTRLSGAYKKMIEIIPGLDEPTEVPFNDKADPSILNGKRLYVQNCAACHGADAKGMDGAFPPLINTKWITGDKSVPVRILLHGLNGEMEVEGQTYNGSMPSFKARLSAAEITAILNYLRAESDSELPEISLRDIIQVSNAHQRTRPWQADELLQE